MLYSNYQMFDFITGVVHQFLSFKGWVPLSRLSYGAYLLNPIIIHAFRQLSEKPVYFEFISLVSKRTSKILINYCNLLL